MRAAIRAAGLALGYTGLLSLVRGKGGGWGDACLADPGGRGMALGYLVCSILYELRGRGDATCYI